MKDKIVHRLTTLLNECLETANQENSFRVISLDTTNSKIVIEFDVIEIEEDDYIGFAAY